MKGFDNSGYLTLYIFFNAIALLMLFTAWKTPKIAQVLFAWESWRNWTAAINAPPDSLPPAPLPFKAYINALYLAGLAII